MSLEQVKYIKVHPGIGMARVGNSPEYFIGPESPGSLPNQGQNYKDSNGLIKPQAARFRVYGYDENDNVVMEITNDPANNVEIQWDVHMRNLKAANYAFQGKYAFDPQQLRNPGVQGTLPPEQRSQLIIDPGSKSISGNNQSNGSAVQLDGGVIFDGIGEAEIPASLINPGEPGTIMAQYNSKEVSLGRLETDASGRLIIVGGKGEAGCLTDPPVLIRKGVSTINDQPNDDPTSNGNSYFNNPGWYDDTAGGSVNATVSLPGGQTLTTNNDPSKRGWIAVAPPKYVPSMNNVVSLLDLQLDLFPDQDPVSGALVFAAIDANGAAEVSFGDQANFNSIDASTAAISAPSIASFNGQQYYAYTGTGNAPVLLTSADGTHWSNVSLTGAPSTPHAPSLCVFNGLLTYVVVDDGGFLHIGTSNDGSTFTFNSTSTGGGVEATPSKFGPAACAYNGSLYIAITDMGGNLHIAQQDDKNPNVFTFYAVDAPQTSLGSPALCQFFGQLSYAFTGTDQKCYIGFYNNYSPKPATPDFNFDFKHVGGSALSNTAPAIVASHGQLYYLILGTNDYPYLASAKPGFTDLTFNQFTTTPFQYAPAAANFNSITFYRDIYPILRTVTDYAWVNEPAFTGHAPGSMGDFLRDNALPGYANPNAENNPYRVFVYRAIRPAETLTPEVPPPPAPVPSGVVPDGGTQQSGRLMPHLYGDGGSDTENNFNGTNYPNQWLSLTPHQLWKFQQWVNGDFTAGEKPVVTPIEQLPAAQQPAALDFSALEPTVGGGFHPGIELTYYMKISGFFAAPFRFADNITDDSGTVLGPISPGSVAAYMSIPWQGDFWSCNTSWWAAMRPDIVVSTRGANPPKLSYQPWFRGEAIGIPPNADSIPDYQGGYEHMARYWSYFGFVVPNGNTDTGMIEMQETERATCLDDDSAPCTPVNPYAPSFRYKLGTAQPASPSSGNFPDTFYTNTVQVAIPADSSALLAGSEDGTADVYVDDQCIVKVNGTQIYAHDFSNGNSGRITPLSPVDLSAALQPYAGTTVEITIEYVDLYPGSKGASAFWLIFEPKQNQIGTAQAASDSVGHFPDTFYSNTLPLFIPANASAKLAGSQDGTAEIYVDDQCIIKVNGTEVYSHDFSNGNSGRITPLPPVDLSSQLQAYGGSTVTITVEYVDLYPNKKGASAFWLLFE